MRNGPPIGTKRIFCLLRGEFGDFTLVDFFGFANPEA